MTPPRPSSTFSRALAAAPEAPVAFGLSFAPPEVLRALGGPGSESEALLGAARSLSLDFAFVDGARREEYEALADAGCEPVAIVQGPLGAAFERVGWTDGLRATVEDPASLRGPMAEAERAAVRAVEGAAEAGASAIVVAEDMAGSDGPLVPPDFAFSESFPPLRRIVEAAAERGLPALLHTDGDSRVFLRAIAHAGFAGLHGGGGLRRGRLEVLLDAVAEVRLAFVGGISTDDLSRGPMQAIGAGSEAGVAAIRGGLLLADDGGMTTAMQAAGFVSAIEAARDAVGDRRG